MDTEMIFKTYKLDLESRSVGATAMREYRITTTAFQAWMKDNGLKAADLRRLHIQAFLQQTGWAPSTQRGRLTWLRSPLSWANAEGYLERNPAFGVRLAPVPVREPEIIPNDVLRAIKRGVETDKELALFTLLAYTGARKAEVMDLQWTDVSFGEPSINIRSGKGGKQRTIPMHPALQDALRALGVFAGDSVYVIPGQTGGKISSTGIDHRIRRMCDRVGHREVTAHAFRRTLCSSLEENDAREAAITQIFGWTKRGDMRLQHYTRVSHRRLYLEMLKAYADDPI